MFHKQEKIISHKYVHFVLSSLKFNLIVIVLYLIQKKKYQYYTRHSFWKNMWTSHVGFYDGRNIKKFLYSSLTDNQSISDDNFFYDFVIIGLVWDNLFSNIKHLKFGAFFYIVNSFIQFKLIFFYSKSFFLLHQQLDYNRF